MLIAHLPAGYLLSRCHPALVRHAHSLMLGAVLPDVDLLWFYAIDSSAPHHVLLPHRPILWTALLCCGLKWHWLAALGLGGLLHLTLDSVAGQIAWGWPMSDRVNPLVIVPATRDWWVMSFLTHWTFLIELAICLFAAGVWVCHRAPLRRPKS